MKKRILSLLLAAALVLGLTPASFALGYIPGPVETWPGGFLVRYGYEIVGYEGEGGDIVIPEGITVVGSWAFQGHTEITSVTIPQGVTKIGSSAFQYCSGLTQVSIPDSVTKIELTAFANTGLTSVVIPGSVEELGFEAFGNCLDLASVILEPGLTEIGNSAFAGSGLTEVVIPDTVTSIEGQAFMGCDRLTSVTIPSSVTQIEQSAFATQSTVFNKNLTVYCEAGSAAAAYAEEWTTPVLGTFDADGTFTPDPVQEDPEPVPSVAPSPGPSQTPEPSQTPKPSPAPSVSPEPAPSAEPSTSAVSSSSPSAEPSVLTSPEPSPGATTSPKPEETTKPDFIIDEKGVLIRYQGTDTDVVIPDGVTEIGGQAFYWSNLTGVTIPDSVKTIGSMAFYGTGLTEVTLPDSVKTIKDQAFGYCKELTQVDLGRGVTTIGREAFRGCDKLEAVTIPDSVEEIKQWAFNRIRIQGTSGGAAEAYAKENGSEYWFTSGTFVDGKFVPDKVVGLENWDEWRWVLDGRKQAIEMYKGRDSYQNNLRQNKELIDSNLYGFGELAYAYTIVTDDVQAQSDEICQGLETDQDKVFAIYRWVTENIYYDYPAINTFRRKSAQDVLDERTAVCDGYSTLFQALCWAQKIPCIRNEGAYWGPSNHAWNAVQVEGEWRWADTTWDTDNAYYGEDRWEKGRTSMTYFLCDTEYISVRHVVTDREDIFRDSLGLIMDTTVSEPYYSIYGDLRYGQDNYLIKSYYTLAAFSDEELAEASKVRVKYGLTAYEREKEQTVEPSSGSSSSGGGSSSGGTTPMPSPTPMPTPKPTPLPIGLPFLDVKAEHWFCANVKQAYAKGLMKGTDDTHFSPTANTTRATIATVLFRLDGEKQGNGQGAFADVVPGAWYADAVDWAAGKGVVKGYDKNTFAPNDNVTREQLAVMLHRYAGPTRKPAKDLSGFADAGSVSPWAAEAMTWAVDQGIINGKGSSTLDPQGLASRAEVCAMLVRFMDLK